MTFKQLIIGFLTLVFVVGITEDTMAQRRKTKKRRPAETEQRARQAPDDYEPIREKLSYELGIGNLQFFNNNLELGAKAGVGYKLNKIITAGLGAKYIFNTTSFAGQNISTHRYGVYPYLNAKIYNGFYAKGLYEYGKYEQAFLDGSGQLFKDGSIETSPWVGIGQSQGGDTWSFGFEILVPLNATIRNNYSVVEYWGMFIYRF